MKEIKRFASLISPAALGIFLLSGVALAGEWKSFDNSEFAAAQKEGKTVVLDFHADWCGTCRKQKTILSGLMKEEKFKGTLGFTVDYDSAADLKKRFGVSKQSTLIVFKGGKEVARSTGVTDKDEITALVSKGL